MGCFASKDALAVEIPPADTKPDNSSPMKTGASSAGLSTPVPDSSAASSDAMVETRDASLNSIDEIFIPPPLPPNEAQRLDRIKKLQILDCATESRFDDIVKMVSSVMRVPVAHISILDTSRVFYVAEIGLGTREIPRDVSGCTWAAQPEVDPSEVFVVENLTEHPRLRSSPMVKQYGARFYAGAPLLTTDGVRLGNLCILDVAPRPFGEHDCTILNNFAELCAREIQKSELETARKEMVTHAVAENRRLARAVEATREPLLLVHPSRPGWPVEFCNTAWRDLTGLDNASLSGRSLWDLIDDVASWGSPMTERRGSSPPPRNADRYASAAAMGVSFAVRCVVQTADGRSIACEARLKPADDPMDINAAQLRPPGHVLARTQLKGGDGATALPPVKLAARGGGASVAAGLTAGHVALGGGGEGGRAGVPYFVTVTPLDVPTGAAEDGRERASVDYPFSSATASVQSILDIRTGLSSALPSALKSSPTPSVGGRSTLPPDLQIFSAVQATLAAQAEPFSDVKLGKMIGRGAYGKVYIGTWAGAQCAVKVIEHRMPKALDESLPESERVASWKDFGPVLEAILSCNVNHPNLVHSYKHASRAVPAEGAYEGLDPRDRPWETWLVLEYCDGGTLSDILEKGRLRDEEGRPRLLDLLGVARDVAGGLTHLHSRGLMHGDLTSNNVMLEVRRSDPRGYRCKVGDYGLTRITTTAGITTQTFGTASYQGPEAFLDKPLTAALDVYSLGVLMWQLYTGEKPWGDLKLPQIVTKVGLQKERLRLPPSAPPALIALVDSCLAFEAQDRPTCAAVLSQVLSMIEEINSEIS